MPKIILYLLCVFSCASMAAHAQTQPKNASAFAFMTAQDVQNNALSNVTIINGTTQSIAVAGLDIVSFDINDCSSCSGNIVGGDNLGGAVVSPVTFSANQKIPIGQNYLYNMIYNGLYYVQTVGSSPCKLPGCSWPDDSSSVTGWCLSMNVISRHASYTHSNYRNGAQLPANAPAYSQAGSSEAFDYNYDLINPAALGGGEACIGPIVCNDKTLTCTVSTAQNETFRSY